MSRKEAVRLFSVLLIGLIIIFTAAPQAQAQTNRLCFSVPNITNCIEGRFREYWEQNGGLAVFGYPISATTQERTSAGTFLTQHFERNRFELHPEKSKPYDVLLGRLGDDELRRQGLEWQNFMGTQPQQDCLWFDATRQILCDDAAPFKSYWENHGLLDPSLTRYQRSLALFGMPLSSPQPETNAAGDTVISQWFERARFEYHPSNPANFRVLLGLLGVEGRTLPAAGTLPADAIWVQSMEKVRAITPTDPFVALSKGQGLALSAASPDDSQVVYYQHTASSQGGGKLWALDVRTGQRRVILEASHSLFGVQFSPDGSRLAVTLGETLESWQLVIVDMRAGGSRFVLRGIEQSYLAPLAWTSAGILATKYALGDAPPQDLLLIDPSNGSVRALRRGDHWGGVISNNGQRLAVVTGKIGFGGEQPELTLTVIDTTSGRETVLISKSSQSFGLLGWSPDGARLAYQTYAAQSNTLHVINADGSDRRSLAFPNNGSTGQLMDTEWRNASTLVLLTARGEESRVYQASLNAFTLNGLQQLGSFDGGLEAFASLLYVPR